MTTNKTQKIRKEIRKKMAFRIRLGYSQCQVARIFDVSTETVRVACREFNTRSTGYYKRKRRGTMAGRVEDGISVDEVANDMDVSAQTVRNACKEFGVDLKNIVEEKSISDWWKKREDWVQEMNNQEIRNWTRIEKEKAEMLRQYHKEMKNGNWKNRTRSWIRPENRTQ